MLQDIKDSLRESGNDLDTEILDLIESAKADLTLVELIKIKLLIQTFD